MYQTTLCLHNKILFHMDMRSINIKFKVQNNNIHKVFTSRKVQGSVLSETVR